MPRRNDKAEERLDASWSQEFINKLLYELKNPESKDKEGNKKGGKDGKGRKSR